MAKKNRDLGYKDDFEMLYLRHEYMKRIDKVDESYVKINAGIVRTTAKIMYSKFRVNFTQVGFGLEDVTVISNLYMLYYMSLYSIKTHPDQLEKVISRRTVPTPQSEVDRIDRNRMINFLRQKLAHCAVICARKARDIVVGVDRRGFFAATEKARDVAQELLLENPKKYGYRKLTAKEFKEAQNRARQEGSTDLTDKNGFNIVKVEILNNGISDYDYSLMTENNKGAYYRSPDQDLEDSEQESLLEAFQIKFNEMSKEEQQQVLKKFVSKNSNNKYLKKELRLAKRLLKKDCGMML